MKTTEMKIVYTEVSMDEVIELYVKGLQPRNGEVSHCKWFYDPSKAIVVLKVFVKEEKNQKTSREAT